MGLTQPSHQRSRNTNLVCLASSEYPEDHYPETRNINKCRICLKLFQQNFLTVEIGFSQLYLLVVSFQKTAMVKNTLTTLTPLLVVGFHPLPPCLYKYFKLLSLFGEVSFTPRKPYNIFYEQIKQTYLSRNIIQGNVYILIIESKIPVLKIKVLPNKDGYFGEKQN